MNVMYLRKGGNYESKDELGFVIHQMISPNKKGSSFSLVFFGDHLLSFRVKYRVDYLLHADISSGSPSFFLVSTKPLICWHVTSVVSPFSLKKKNRRKELMWKSNS